VTTKRIALPPRLQGGAVDRLANGWRIWLHTNDYKLGTYLLLLDDGSAKRVTTYADEGDEEWKILP
jgi:hypothetical protein